MTTERLLRSWLIPKNRVDSRGDVGREADGATVYLRRSSRRRQVDKERHLDHLRKHVIAVPPAAVLADDLAVVRRQHYNALIVQLQLLEPVDERAETGVDAF